MPSLIGQKARSQRQLRLRSGGRRPRTDPLLSGEGPGQLGQAALTVEGKIGNFDLTYAFAHLNRNDEVHQRLHRLLVLVRHPVRLRRLRSTTTTATLINPSQYIQGKDRYRKTSHELRIASPQDDRLRFVGGVFWQNQ